MNTPSLTETDMQAVEITLTYHDKTATVTWKDGMYIGVFKASLKEFYCGNGDMAAIKKEFLKACKGMQPGWRKICDGMYESMS